MNHNPGLFPTEARLPLSPFGGEKTLVSGAKINDFEFQSFLVRSIESNQETVVVQAPNSNDLVKLSHDFFEVHDFDLNNFNSLDKASNGTETLAIVGDWRERRFKSTNQFVAGRFNPLTQDWNGLIFGDASAPTVVARSVSIGSGKRYGFVDLEFRDDQAISLNDLRQTELVFRSDSGINLATSLRMLRSTDGTVTRALYSVEAPNGVWDIRANGTFTASFSSTIRDLSGKALTGASSITQHVVAFQNQQSNSVDNQIDFSESIDDDWFYQLVQDERVIFADFDGLNQGLSSSGFRHVATNSRGHLAFSYHRHSNSTGDQYLIGVWNGRSNHVRVVDTGSTVTSLKLANNGSISVALDDGVYVYRPNLKTRNVVAAGRFFQSIGDVDFSADGRVVAFTGALNKQGFERFGYQGDIGTSNTNNIFVGLRHQNAFRLHRIMGVKQDFFQDSGEQGSNLHSGFSSIANPISVVSTLGIDGSFTVGFIAEDGYAIDMRTGGQDSFGNGGVYALNAFVTHGTRLSQNPPLLISSRSHLNRRFGYLNQNYTDKWWHHLTLDAARNPSNGEFSFVSLCANRAYNQPHSGVQALYEAARQSKSTGRLPQYAKNLGKSARHAILEQFSKGTAYWTSTIERGEVLANSYVYNGVLNSKTGLRAIELLPFAGRQGNLLHSEPILVFRGTNIEADTDWIRSASSAGIGFTQFQDMKSTVRRWLVSQSRVYSAKPVFTGHGSGGSIAQWFTVDASRINRPLSELVTFNATGISRNWTSTFEPATVRRGVHHYITSGDIVSLIGQSFVSGRTFMSEMQGHDLANKHLSPILARRIAIEQNQNRSSMIRQRDRIRPLSFGWFDSNSFRYRDWYYQQFLVRMQDEFPFELRTRGTVEAFRRRNAWALQQVMFRLKNS